jgi:hypothetical protein
VNQIIWIIARLNSIKIDIFDDDLLEALYITLEYSLNEEIVGVIFDIIKFNMSKEKSNTEKLVIFFFICRENCGIKVF